MSCCGGNCACGPNCKCGNGCNGCNMYTGLAEGRIDTTEIMILAVAPTSRGFEGFEMTLGSENGCKCGSNCTCDPCNCK